MTKCPACRKDINPEFKFCPYCGSVNPDVKPAKSRGVDIKIGPVFYGFPLINIAVGRDEKGRLRVAKGVIAIGQFGIGIITFAQFGIGILFGFGQMIIGLTAIAQVAIGAVFGLGQLATGYIAIGQIVLGWYGLAQFGLARYIWTPDHRDIEAVMFFHRLPGLIRNIFSFK